MAGFLEIDLKTTSSERLVDYLRDLGENPNHSELVGKIRKELILRGMKEKKLNVPQIVRVLVRGSDKRIWPHIAHEWAGSLDLTEFEFLRIAGGKATS